MSPEYEGPETSLNDDATLTRRKFMSVAGSGALALGVGSLVSTYGPSAARASTIGRAASGSPKRGGTLRVGMTGGGTGDMLEAQNGVSNVDIIRVGALNEQLVIVNPVTGQNELALAESIEPNKNGTEWTIRVRPDVLFHNGKPFTAADVLYSFQRIQKNKFPGAVSFGPMNLKAVKMLDKRTLRIPFDAPFVIFADGLAQVTQNLMVPQGYNPKSPIGTGPFKFKSFTPGVQSDFVRFDEYWQHGKPYLDELIISDFASETAQVNAMRAGQVDLVPALSYASVPLVKGSGGKVVVSKSAAYVPFYMRVDTAPFSDVRVRQALRLIPNRSLFNEQIFGGLGQVGNDVYGIKDPAYAGLLPQRHQNIAQAKSLLKSAGHSDLKVSLYSAAVGPGSQSMASIFATQAAAAGVKVNIVTQDPTTYYANSYAKVPFAMSFWNFHGYLLDAQQAVAKGAPYNEIHQSNPHWQKLYNQAIKTVNESARDEIIKEMMRFDYDQGGYIIPVFFPELDGMATKVNGVTPNITGYPVNGGTGWQDIWMA